MELYQIRDLGNDIIVGLGVIASAAWCGYGLLALSGDSLHSLAVLMLAVGSLAAGMIAAVLHSAAWRIGLWCAGRDSFVCMPLLDD